MKPPFATISTHDWKSINNGVSGYTELLIDGSHCARVQFAKELSCNRSNIGRRRYTNKNIMKCMPFQIPQFT